MGNYGSMRIEQLDRMHMDRRGSLRGDPLDDMQTGSPASLMGGALDAMQTGSRSPEKAIKGSYEMSADNPFMDMDASE